LWRETNDGDFLNAVGAHLADYISDVRMPVTHGDVDGDVVAGGGKFIFDKTALFDGDFSERAVADKRISMLNFFNDWLRKRAATGDLEQVFGDLVNGLWGSVSEEEEGLFRHARLPPGGSS